MWPYDIVIDSVHYLQLTELEFGEDEKMNREFVRKHKPDFDKLDLNKSGFLEVDEVGPLMETNK